MALVARIREARDGREAVPGTNAYSRNPVTCRPASQAVAVDARDRIFEGNASTVASAASLLDGVYRRFARRPGMRATERLDGTGMSADLQPARPPRVLREGRGLRALAVIAFGAAGLCLLPIIAVAIAAALGGTETLAGLAGTLLPRYAATTAFLMGLVATGTFLVGTGAAWLVTACEFPGRRWLEIGLVLPLAFPAYVLAYAYTHLLDHPGAVQSFLRDVTGWGPRDYWFPEIRSEGGAAMMLVLVLYPYVYLLARAAFLRQGLAPFAAARTLGRSPWRAFRSVAMPMARPAIAAGVLLALMETIADFGTVAYFGVQTLATGIYTAWFTLGDRGASAQIALGLLAIALLLVALERLTGPGEGGTAQRRERASPARMRLRSGAAAAASVACALPVILGAILPAALLASMAIGSEQDLFSPRYLDFLSNSLILAAVAALVTVSAAIAIGYYRRAARTMLSLAAVQVSRMGYALPGGVIAVGLFVPFAAFDNALDTWAREVLGASTGLLFAGSIALLVMAYMIRFMAAALGAWDTGLQTVTRSLDDAGRTLGCARAALLRRVHLPLLWPSALTALLLVFVDTMKELPATLIMRPFGWDTLAVQAYRLAADERLEGAAVPSLVIVAVGLLPVILLCRRVGRGS